MSGNVEEDEIEDDTAEAEELEELAAKLYPKLRHKLQAGLLVERERAGMLTDLY